MRKTNDTKLLSFHTRLAAGPLLSLRDGPLLDMNCSSYADMSHMTICNTSMTKYHKILIEGYFSGIILQMF